MSHTVTKDEDTLNVRAVITGDSELRELIVLLLDYLPPEQRRILKEAMTDE